MKKIVKRVKTQKTRTQLKKNPLLISKGNKPRRGEVVICNNCGKETYRSPSMVRLSKLKTYCSSKCHYEGMKKNKPLVCINCGQEYYRAISQVKWRGSKYCSKKCKGEVQLAKYKKARHDKTRYPKKLSVFKKWVWKVFSDYTRERDKWTCFTCGRRAIGSQMHAGHFIPRTYGATVFDEMNVHAQCYGCNIWKRGNAGEYSARIISLYGKEKYDELIEKSRQIHKFTYEELEELYQTYKHKLKDIKTLL